MIATLLLIFSLKSSLACFDLITVVDIKGYPDENSVTGFLDYSTSTYEFLYTFSNSGDFQYIEYCLDSDRRWEIVYADSFGDGWHGGTIDLYVNGIHVYGTSPSGYGGSFVIERGCSSSDCFDLNEAGPRLDSYDALVSPYHLDVALAIAIPVGLVVLCLVLYCYCAGGIKPQSSKSGEKHDVDSGAAKRQLGQMQMTAMQKHEEMLVAQQQAAMPSPYPAANPSTGYNTNMQQPYAADPQPPIMQQQQPYVDPNMQGQYPAYGAQQSAYPYDPNMAQAYPSAAPAPYGDNAYPPPAY